MQVFLNWTPIGLLLDLIGFWLIVWYVLPRYLLDKKRRSVMGAILNINKLQQETRTLYAEQQKRIEQIVEWLNKEGQCSDFWKEQLAKHKLMSIGHLKESKKEVYGNVNALSELAELQKRMDEFSAIERPILKNLIAQMRNIQIDYKDWEDIFRHTWKNRRPFSEHYWESRISVIKHRDEEFITEAQRLDSRFVRSPVLLGTILVTGGFVFQLLGYVLQ